MEEVNLPEWLVERRERNRSGMRVWFPETSREDGEYDKRSLLADVAFNRHSMNDGHHVGPSDNGMVQVGTDGIRVALAQGIDVEALKKTLTMATRATIGIDMTQTLPGDWEVCNEFSREEIVVFGAKCPKHSDHKVQPGSNDPMLGRVPTDDWEEMLKGGLQTALETQIIVLAVGGVSRTCTHQLVRSRRASFHQQSQRASYMGDCPEVRMPESVWRNERARKAFFKATIACWRAYQIACEEDISYQDARFALQEGTTNFILLEYSVREFLNVYAYRACSMFQWEIVQVMRQARDVLVAEYPWLEPYIKISCEKTGPVMLPLGGRGGMDDDQVVVAEHHCTFQGWEDVEGQCDFSWAKHEARTFKPEFHRISREAKS